MLALLLVESTDIFCKYVSCHLSNNNNKSCSLYCLQLVVFETLTVAIVVNLGTLRRPVHAERRIPLPRVEDLYATLGGGTVFSKVDLTSA